jgi:hypothetical protein
MAFTGIAQVDSTKQEGDTIRVGNMIIIKKPGDRSHEEEREREVKTYSRSRKRSPITTNWGIVDLGFTNYIDETDYSGPGIQDPSTGFAPGLAKQDFKLRAAKSTNVNIWIFMQRFSMIKNVVNLKYGVGVELNNYRYKRPVKYYTDPITQVKLDNSTEYKKNKLAADYLTVPMMLNFNFAPRRENGFGFSVGASVGYLYSSRQKTITEADGKRKKHEEFDLRPWKVSYIAELSLGPIRLYGSYAMESMFEKGLNQRPYSVGFRLDNSDW